MPSDVREYEAAQWASRGTRLLALVYVWLSLWLLAFVAVPALLGSQPVVITSGSMGPLIGRGDVILLEDAPPDLGPGAVATFRDDAGRRLTHRIVAVDATGAFITQGDANPTPDAGTLTGDRIEGIGRLLVPYVGAPVLWLRDTPFAFLGWALLTIVAASIAMPRREQTARAEPDETAREAVGLEWPRAIGWVLARVDRPARRPSRIRAWTPSVMTLFGLAFLSPGVTGWVLGLLLLVLIVLADPRGPEIRVGRFLRWWNDVRDRFESQFIPRVRQSGVALSIPLIALAAWGATGTAPRSAAAFTDVTSDAGGRITTGYWSCTAGTQVLALEGDTFTDAGAPGANNDGAAALQITWSSTVPTAQQDAYLQVGVTAPSPACGISSATLNLDVIATDGADLEVQAVSGLDTITATWASPPTTVGGTVTATPTVGPWDVDVTTLMAAGGNGFVVRSAQTAAITTTTLESLETPGTPTLTIVWVTVP